LLEDAMNLVRDIPPIRSIPFFLEAELYNRASHDGFLEVELEGIAIDMVLEKNCWTGYLNYQTSLPMIAWNDFETRRSALNAPVACTMHLYHQQAWLQSQRCLQALDNVLQKLTRIS
jgi:hypothetical protein